jgi:hypothetical protein
MKPLFFAALIAQVLSCSKPKVGSGIPDNKCIDRVVARPGQTSLSAGQLDSIHILFSQNNIKDSQLQFFAFRPDINTDSTLAPQAQVSAILFINGLPVFNKAEVYMFNAGIFDTAYLYTGAPLTNDSSGHLSLPSLRSIFLKFVAQTIKTYSSAALPPIFSSADNFNDTCLSATLGYMDAFYVPGGNQPTGTLIKVWKITPSDNGFPVLYVEDDDGSAWWGFHLVGP